MISAIARERISRTLYYALRALILLTPALLVWQYVGMNKVFEISPASGHRITAKDDRAFNGTSVAALSQTDKSAVMDCRIEKKYEWPFCDMTIQLAEPPEGVDLSTYDSMSLDVKYSGVGPATLRFFIRNFEDGISKPSRFRSLKVNEAEFDVPKSGRIDVPLKYIRVASWWLSEERIPLVHSDVRIDRVPYVEISTASLAEPGHHRIEMQSIRFHGKWISQKDLAIALVVVWLLFGISKLVMDLIEFKVHLRTVKQRVKHLVTVLRARQDGNLAGPYTDDRPHLRKRAHVLPDAYDDLVEGNGSAESSQPTAGVAAAVERESGVQLMEPPPQAEDSADKATPVPQAGRPTYLRWISATVGNSVRFIAVEHIIYFQTEQKYTRVVLSDSEVLIKKSLKELLTELDPDQFWRIHRSIVINALEIHSIEPNKAGQLVMKLKTRSELLPVSDSFMRRTRQM